MLRAVVVCLQAFSGSVVGLPDTIAQPLKPLTHIHFTALLSACNQKQNFSSLVSEGSRRYSTPRIAALFIRMSSFPKRAFKKSANRAMLGASVISS